MNNDDNFWEDDKSWFRRHWVISIFLLLVIIGTIGTNLGGENSTISGNSIRGEIYYSNASSFIPLNEEIDTNWKIVGRKETIVEFDNFEEGFSLEIDKLNGLSLSTGYVFVNIFEETEDAKGYYQEDLNYWENERGYEKISSPVDGNCFAIKYGNYLEGYSKYVI